MIACFLKKVHDQNQRKIVSDEYDYVHDLQGTSN